MLKNSLLSVLALALLSFSGVSLATDSSEDFREVLADDTTAEADTVIYSVRVRIPTGRSTWTADLGQNYTSNPVKLRYVVEPSCRAPYVNMSLRSATDGSWQQTIVSGDVDTHTLTAFNGVRFDFDQPLLGTVTCEMLLFGTNGGSIPNTGWGPGVLSGGVEYNGGFSQNMEVAISSAERIKGFRLAIPEFCQGVDILEAGTMTEGNFDAATVVDAAKRIYKVASGSVRASRIRFSLNGPFDARCFVPVFIYAAE